VRELDKSCSYIGVESGGEATDSIDAVPLKLCDCRTAATRDTFGLAGLGLEGLERKMKERGAEPPDRSFLWRLELPRPLRPDAVPEPA
jgi:hypothetical protein